MGLFDWLSPKRKAPRYSDEQIRNTYASSEPGAVRRMENELYRQTFAYLPHSKKTVSQLPNADERRQAYTDAFLDFSQQMKTGRFRGDSSVRTFFTGIFKHKILDILKHKQTNTYKSNQPGAVELERRLQGLSPKSKDILEQLLTREKVEQTKAVLRTLYAGKTSCYELLLLDDSDAKRTEIASFLGLTPGSVKTKISDCRKQLLAAFEKNK